MLDEISSLNALAATVFNNTSMGVFSGFGFTSDTNGNYGGIIYSTPDGSPITFACVFCYIGGYRQLLPTIVFPLIGLVSAELNSGNGTTPVGGGFPPPMPPPIIPYCQFQITGPNNNQIYAQVVNGQTTSGSKTSPTWPGSTGGDFYFTAVNP